MVGQDLSAHGALLNVSAVVTEPSGTETSPNGVQSTPSGTESWLNGSLNTEEGVEDAGGGGRDLLVMKIEPSGW